MKEPKRFWSKVDVGDPEECWEWLVGKFHDGYGSFQIPPLCPLWPVHPKDLLEDCGYSFEREVMPAK